jgi:hypothetical protein
VRTCAVRAFQSPVVLVLVLVLVLGWRCTAVLFPGGAGRLLKGGDKVEQWARGDRRASRAVNRSGGYVRVFGPGWVEAQLVRIGVRIREGRGDRRAGEGEGEEEEEGKYGQRK